MDTIVDASEALELLDVGIGVFDEGLRLSYCNAAFRSLRDYPEALCADGARLEDLLLHSARRGDFGPGDPKAQVAERIAEIKAADDREIEREMSDGQILGIRYQRSSTGQFVITYKDITAARSAERALRQSEERYALVSEAAEEALYEWDIVTDRFFASPRLIEFIGSDPRESGQTWGDRVHTDDLAHYRATLERHLSGAEPRWSCEYRLSDAQGAWRWVSDHGTSVRDDEGRAVRMVAAIRDVTERVEREAALAAGEERHTLVTQATSDWIYDWNAADDVLYISEGVIQHLDLTTNTGTSALWNDLIHPDDYDGYVDDLREHFRGRAEAVERDYRVRARGGGYRWVHDRGVGVRDANGRVTRLVGAVTDITDVRAAQSELETTRDRLMASLATIADGMLLVTPDNRVELFNERYVEIFSKAAGGADLSEVIVRGRDFFEMIREGYNLGMFKPHPDGVDAWIAARREAWKKPVTQWELELANGTWILLSERQMPDGGRVSVYTDVTEFKRRQAEIERQSEILQLTLENMGQGITLVDKDLKTIALNRKFLELLDLPEDRFGAGFTMEEAFRYNAERGEYGPGDLDEQVRERLALAGKFQAHKFERVKPDGSVLEIAGNPIEGGGFVSTYTDITERKRAEEALRAAIAEFDAVLENIDYGVLFMGPDLRARIVNRAFGRIWNIPQDFIDQRPTMQELIEYNRETGVYDVAPEDWDDWVAGRVEAIKIGDIPPGEFRRADGKVLSYQCVALPDGGRMLTYFDITELKRAEQFARDSEARLRGILENSPIGVALIDDDDIIHFHNAQFARILRGPDRDLVGQSSTQFRMDDQSVEDWKQRFREFGRVIRREMRYRGLDGGEVWSQTTYERAEWQGVPCRLTWIYDVTEEKANREALVEARDAAEAALADLRKAQERLVQSEKMASLGQLTAGIAHEIKNPLNFVNNFAKLSAEMVEELGELLEDPMKALDDEDREDAEDLMQTVRENLGKINEHGRRADSIVRNMLLHSREGPSERQETSINAIAEEALNLAYHAARAEDRDFNIEIVREMDPDVGAVACYPQDLMRVFLNLITNGMYATNKRKAAEGDDYRPTVSLTTRTSGNRIEVEVRDNGTGIPAEVRERIFLPFFTTKPAGEGTGLGLSLSYDIVVKQHDGELTVESEPGEYTAFVVALPRAQAAG